MERLDEVVQKLYKKYQPRMAKNKTVLELDFADTTVVVKDARAVEKKLDRVLDGAATRTVGGVVKISVQKKSITVKDDGMAVSRTECEKMSCDEMTVKSRVGFGTTVEFLL